VPNQTFSPRVHASIRASKNRSGNVTGIMRTKPSTATYFHALQAPSHVPAQYRAEGSAGFYGATIDAKECHENSLRRRQPRRRSLGHGSHKGSQVSPSYQCGDGRHGSDGFSAQRRPLRQLRDPISSSWIRTCPRKVGEKSWPRSRWIMASSPLPSSF
jgi:hypothetical protein